MRFTINLILNANQISGHISQKGFVTQGADIIMICGFHINHMVIYCGMYLVGHGSNNCPCSFCCVAIGCICVIYKILLSTFSISYVSKARLPITIFFYAYMTSMSSLLHYVAVVVYKIVRLSFGSAACKECCSTNKRNYA
jgi:hypothetical protein